MKHNQCFLRIGSGFLLNFLADCPAAETPNRYTADSLLKPEDIDGVVVMCGPLGVHDVQDYPWLRKEKRFIRECIDDNKKVLGV